MPVVQSPVVRVGEVPQYDLSGFGALARAIYEAYQNRRPVAPGSYTSPTGATTSLSPAEVTRGNPNMTLQQALEAQRPAGATFTKPKYQYQFPGNLDRQLQQLQLQQAQQQLSGFPVEQAYKQAQTKNLQQQGDYFTALQKLYGNSQLGADGQVSPPPSPSPVPLPPEIPSSPQTSTERALTPTPLFPFQNIIERGVRAVQRASGERETPAALTETYKSRTATAAKGFNDSGNVAVEERKSMQDSFPKDGESFERRKTKEASIFQFFDQKKAQLNSILQQKNTMVLKGMSKNGPQYQIDPGLSTMKKEAAKDLQKLQGAETLYRQMFDEANVKMPPIGAVPKNDANLSNLQQQFPGAKITKIK